VHYTFEGSTRSATGTPKHLPEGGELVDQFLDVLANYDILDAYWLNVKLAVLSGLFALVLGTILALMRISPIGSLKWAGSANVTLIRNTPLTVLMVFAL